METLKTPMRLLALICLSSFTVTLAQSPSPYTLTGELNDESGRPFSGATACALPVDGVSVRVGDKICTKANAEGKFVINLPRAGKYQVAGEKMSDGYVPSYLPFYRDPKRPIPEIIVGDDTPTASVSITLGPPSGLITGKVIDEATDTPVQNFVVWVWQERDPNARHQLIVKGINSPGRFQLYAPPAPFRMRIVAEGYEDWVMGGGVLVSAGGARKGPGSLLARSGTTADFAVYLKRKKQDPVEPQNNRDEKRLTAPVQLSPLNDAMFDVFPRITKLEWAPVAGAASYAIEVESCWALPTNSRILDDGECVNPSPYLEKVGILETAFEFAFKGAQPGRWRVWAIDSDHRPGHKSAWRRFVHQK